MFDDGIDESAGHLFHEDGSVANLGVQFGEECEVWVTGYQQDGGVNLIVRTYDGTFPPADLYQLLSELIRRQGLVATKATDRLSSHAEDEKHYWGAPDGTWFDQFVGIAVTAGTGVLTKEIVAMLIKQSLAAVRKWRASDAQDDWRNPDAYL